MVEHEQEVFELEKGDNVILEFSDGERLNAEVISGYSTTPKGEVLFNAEDYDKVLTLKGGNEHRAAILRGGEESFGFVREVERL